MHIPLLLKISAPKARENPGEHETHNATLWHPCSLHNHRYTMTFLHPHNHCYTRTPLQPPQPLTYKLDRITVIATDTLAVFLLFFFVCEGVFFNSSLYNTHMSNWEQLLVYNVLWDVKILRKSAGAQSYHCIVTVIQSIFSFADFTLEMYKSSRCKKCHRWWM